MAINSCSINAFTINSLACRRPQAIINANKPHPQRAAYNSWSVNRETDDIVQTLEGSHINVAVTLNGKTYEQTIENSINDIIPMIVLSAINIETITNQVVVVSNLKISTEKR